MYESLFIKVKVPAVFEQRDNRRKIYPLCFRDWRYRFTIGGNRQFLGCQGPLKNQPQTPFWFVKSKMFDNFAMTEIIPSETQTAEYGMYFIQFQFQNA